MIQLDQGGRVRTLAVRIPAQGAAAALAEELSIIPEIGPSAYGAEGWRVIPDAHPHIIVVRYPSGRTRASVVGARSTWVDVDQGLRSWTVGARLRPGALPILTGLSAHELLDRGLSVAELPGDAGRWLLDTLVACSGPRSAASALSAFLERVAAGGGEADWKVRGLVHSLSSAPRRQVADVSDDLGVASRTLREAARHGVGLSPKRIQRVIRLQRALLLASGPERPFGSVVAVRAGYADQAHWTNDCTDLLGEPPGVFLRRGAGSYKTEAASPE